MTQDKPGRKFKVCLLSVSLAKGGAERSCAMLSRMLSDLGHEVHLALLNNEIDFEFKAELFLVDEFKKPNENEFQRIMRFKRFRRFLQNQKFDVIIDHRPKNQYYRELFYHRYVYRKFPIIHVAHSSHKESYLTQKPSKFVRLANRNVANVAVSSFIEDNLLKAHGVMNTTTIHNAYDESWGQTEESIPEQLKDGKYILSYGRIDDSIKDFSFLIDSFEHSKLSLEGYKLVILGDGDDKEMLRTHAASKESGKSIVFHPFVRNPFSFIKNARFVTLTSRYEGFPMVLVESLSLGTPLVSLDIKSGPNEIIGHEYNGLLVKGRVVEDFSEAMKRMIFDEELYIRCKKNSKESVTPFSMREIGQKWNKLLNDVL